MSFFATDESVSAPAQVAAAHVSTRFCAAWTAVQAEAVPLFFCAALWALSHPYAGIIHDARIYIGRVMADLDPAGIGRDMMFVHDGQFAFSLFPFIIHGLVAHLGPGATAKIVSGLGCLCSFAAAIVLAIQLVKGRAVWLMLVFACVLPHAYGSQVFQTAETMAVPRPFAEAAVLLSLAALISGRPRTAIALVLVGAALHPIMALAGTGVFAFFYWRDWRIVALALAGAIVSLILALASAPLFSRLLMTMDAQWLDLLLHLHTYLSPLQWTSHDWGAVIVQSVSIAIAADLLSGPARRVFAASLVVGLGGLLAAILLGDLLVSLLAIQMQFWRTIWLLAALAPFAFALCVVRLGAEAAHGLTGRVTLAILTFGWFSNPDIVVASVIAALALITHFNKRNKKIPTKYLVALGAAMTGLTLFSYTHTLIESSHFLERFPLAPLAVYSAVRFSVAALPICLAAMVWVWAKPQLFRAQSLGVFGGVAMAAAAAIFWVSLPPAANDLEAGRQPKAFASILDGRAGEVLWVGGSAESWYFLGRPQWASGLQPVSAVFSRPLAMLWRERAQVLLDNGLAPRNIFEPRKQIEDSAVLDVTRAALDSFCTREDAPVAVIFPVEKNKPLPAGLDAAIWTPPHQRFISDANDKTIWHEIDRYAGVPCAKAGKRTAERLIERNF